MAKTKVKKPRNGERMSWTAYTMWSEGHTKAICHSTAMTPKEARTLAKWLNQFADWTEEQKP